MGLFRFVLAVFVVVQHVAGVPLIGSHAVFCFFMLFGYLMTHVTIETYGHSPPGFVRFWTNLVLRLYPAYLAVVLLSVGVLALVGGGFTARANGALRLPADAGQWFQTLTMLYATHTPIQAIPRLSPPTWALTVELFNYFPVSLGLSSTRESTLVWLALASLFQAWALLLSGQAWLWSYGSLFGACFPFTLGTLKARLITSR